jgi:acyl-homoserine lactone synthase
MVFVITREVRSEFREELAAMHRDRKRLFVDILKWDVPVVDEVYEIDQFDTDDAVYLLAVDPRTGRHTGSMRLLPTTRPHLLSAFFSELCDDAPPVSDDTWEITRLCLVPSLSAGERLRVRHQLVTALVEFGLLYGVSCYTCVCETSFLSQILAMGWDCEPLGLPQRVGGQVLGALALNVTPATLQLFRSQWGCPFPVLELSARRAA